MNNTFNINRFGLLLRRQWLEFGKIFLITLAVAFGVIAAFYMVALWSTLTSGYYSGRILTFREPLFMIFGGLFITVVSSNYFAHLGQKSRTIIDLLVPASTFEKFVTAVFFTLIIVTISFVAIFYLTDLAFVTKLNSLDSLHTMAYDGNKGVEKDVVANFEYYFGSKKIFTFAPFYAAPAIASSIFLLGSIYFDKFHYIKTAISVLLFSGVGIYIVVKCSEFLMSNRRPTNMRGFVVEGDNVQYIILFVLLLLAAVFWAITYVRLKEKEV